MGHKRFNQTAINMGQWESQRALAVGACYLEFPGLETERNLTRRNGQLEMSTALKKALLGKNRKTLDKVPVVGKDETGSAKQKRELGKLKEKRK